MANFFLDIDQASPVFTLLFTFVRDSACDHADLFTFEDAIAEIFLGIQIPKDAETKLRKIFEQATLNRTEFSQLVERVALDFEQERDTLLSIMKILLRLSLEEGLISQRDKERMQEVVCAFRFSVSELRSLSAVEHQFIDFLNTNTQYFNALYHSEELLVQYKILGCSPGCSDRELKTAYRSLAKIHHPDVHVEPRNPQSTRFQEIHDAFHAIRQARSLGMHSS